MPTIDRQELDRLERRNLQLTILSAVFVLILAGGLAMFMYPLVFVHPEENKATMRVAFFGFCALTLLFVGYLFDRQRTFTKLKQHLLAELERNVTLQLQASADLLNSMPDQNHFWDRLSMEFRRALTMEKNMSLVLAKANPATRATVKDEKGAFSDAAKAIAKRLRPTDSIYHLAEDLFGIVLPETDTLNAKRIALRLQEGLQQQLNSVASGNMGVPGQQSQKGFPVQSRKLLPVWCKKRFSRLGSNMCTSDNSAPVEVATFAISGMSEPPRSA